MIYYYIATLQVSRASHLHSRKVVQRLYITFILWAYLTIQRRHVLFVAIQFATKPRESLLIAFVLLLPLLKCCIHHLPLLAYRSTATWGSSMEHLCSNILSDQGFIGRQLHVYVRTFAQWLIVKVDCDQHTPSLYLVYPYFFHHPIPTSIKFFVRFLTCYSLHVWTRSWQLL